jgi:hypothetical protein
MGKDGRVKKPAIPCYNRKKKDERFTAAVERICALKSSNDVKAKALGRSVRTIQRLKNKIANKVPLSAQVGRRPKFTHKAKQAIVKKVLEKYGCRKAADRGKFREFVGEALQESATEMGLVTFQEEVCRTVMWELQEELNIGFAKAQDTTKARREAVQDYRNFISLCAMLMAYGDVESPKMSFNFDSTQFHIRFDGTNKDHFFIKQERGNLPLAHEGSGDLGMSVKLMWLNNANGHCGDLTFIVSDDSLSDDDVKVYQVPDMTTTRRKSTRTSVFCIAKGRW